MLRSYLCVLLSCKVMAAVDFVHIGRVHREVLQFLCCICFTTFYVCDTAMYLMYYCVLCCSISHEMLLELGMSTNSYICAVLQCSDSFLYRYYKILDSFSTRQTRAL